MHRYESMITQIMFQVVCCFVSLTDGNNTIHSKDGFQTKMIRAVLGLDI